ncbi:MAG: MlrC C-terminal domain-containing protein [Candidatus Hodarchaeota archaeon]
MSGGRDRHSSEGETQVILADRWVAMFEPSLILDLGLNLKDFKIFAVKCGYQGPKYKAIAARSILVLTPGDTTQDLANLRYSKTPRPIYPLDKETKWP